MKQTHPRLRHAFKTVLSTSLLVLLSCTTHAQDNPEKLLQRGNKVYIHAKNRNVGVHAKRMLEYRDYWELADDADDADFIIDIKAKAFWLGCWKAYAVFIDPDTEKPFYKTKRVTTLWSLAFNKKQKAVKKLVRKRIGRYYKRVNKKIARGEL